MTGSGRLESSAASRSIAWLVVVIAAAVVLRIVPALIHPLSFPDSADYRTLAMAIIHGGPYEVNGLFASRMPGYPVFMAAIYAVAGESDRAVVVVQAFIGGAIVYLTYLLARRAGEGVGLLAAALAAVDPLSIGFAAALLSEIPFTVLLLTGLWICLRLIDKPRWSGWLALGVVWAIAVYLRAEALPCIVPLGLFVWAGNRKLKIENGKRKNPRPGAFSIFYFLFSILVVILALLPWQIRNDTLFHSHFFRLTTLEGLSLYEAVYPEATGGPRQDQIALPPDMQGLSEAQRNDEWARRGWHYVFTDPGRIARLAIGKIARTWSVTLNAGEFQNPALQVALALWHIPLFVFAFLGLFTPVLPSKIKVLLLIPVVYFTLLHALFLGSVRYRVPLMPLVCIFAAGGVTWLLQRLKHRKPEPRSTV